MVTYHVIENIKHPDFWRALACELLATTLYMILGVGSIGYGSLDSSNHIRVALAFGMGYAVLYRIFGPISGCHANPAISISQAVIGRLSLARGFLYVFVQIIGAVLGAGSLFLLTGSSLAPNCLSKDIQLWQGFCLESIFGFVLSLIFCTCSDYSRDDNRDNQSNAPIVLGSSIAVLHLVGLPFTSAGFNPARSFAPAVIFLKWTDQWLYCVAPIVGACIGSVAYRVMMHKETPLVTSVKKKVPTITDVSREFHERFGMVESSLSNQMAPNLPTMDRRHQASLQKLPLVIKHIRN